MKKKVTAKRLSVDCLRVNQWPQIWDSYNFSSESHRARPLNHFFMCSMRASTLKSLSGVNRRTRESTEMDLGIQRRHDKSRSEEIGRYVKYGYPFSGMSEAKQKLPESSRVRQPGWLPTAVVVNIVKPQDKRRGISVDGKDLVEISESKNGCHLLLPTSYKKAGWFPKALYPIEVIDGQHRLFAFDDENLEDFEVPVVVFYGLDIGWQAYLFWTINIKPKKINPSLAFDLYPLLRTQDWLEQGDDYSLYRDTRAQELTERLWAYPKSAWYRRIDMIGDGGRQYVSQAAWVRSITTTLIKRWSGKGISIGGLFGAKLKLTSDPLPWSRVQQAAFLISFWNELLSALVSTNHGWAKELRTSEDNATLKFREKEPDLDPAFYGPHTLINQDQGVRVLLHALNDVFFLNSEATRLTEWVSTTIESDDDLADNTILTGAIASVKEFRANQLMMALCRELARYDWRSSTAPGLTESEAKTRRLFRGSGGYIELRRECMMRLRSSKNKLLKKAANRVISSLRTIK